MAIFNSFVKVPEGNHTHSLCTHWYPSVSTCIYAVNLYKPSLILPPVNVHHQYHR